MLVHFIQVKVGFLYITGQQAFLDIVFERVSKFCIVNHDFCNKATVGFKGTTGFR